MKCLLAKAGLTSFIKDSPSLHVNMVSSSSADAIIAMKKLFTKDAAKKLIAKYSVDYDLFGFSKEPAWVEEATGEWYDQEPHPPLFIQTDSREKHMGKGHSNSDGRLVLTSIEANMHGENSSSKVDSKRQPSVEAGKRRRKLSNDGKDNQIKANRSSSSISSSSTGA